MTDRQTPKFTRRDFQFIADVIKDLPPTVDRETVAIEFATALKITNPNFKRDRFLTACKLRPLNTFDAALRN